MKKTTFLCLLFFAHGPLFAQIIPSTPTPCAPADHGAPNFVTYAFYSPFSPGILQIGTVSYEPIHDVSARVSFNDGTQAFSLMTPSSFFPSFHALPQYMAGDRVGASVFISATSNIDPELASMGVTDLGSCSVICAGSVELNDLVEIAKLPQVTSVENATYVGGPPPNPCGYWVYFSCIPFDPAVKSVSAVTVTGASASGAVGTSDGSFLFVEYGADGRPVDPLLQSALWKFTGFDFLPPQLVLGAFTCPPTPHPTPTPTATPFPTPVPADTLWVSKNLFRPPKDAGALEIRVGIHRAGTYPLEIYNSAGEMVARLGPIMLEGPGEETLAWDGTNKNGEDLASGIYLIRIATGLGVLKARVLLLR